jgi:hypothetical protein
MWGAEGIEWSALVPAVMVLVVLLQPLATAVTCSHDNALISLSWCPYVTFDSLITILRLVPPLLFLSLRP